MSFEPINPVTVGHLLFVPREHVQVAGEKPWVTGHVFEAAAEYGRARGMDYNLITSSGEYATQTIEHLHVHYIPRRFEDGLHLPWTGQVKK